MHGKDYKFYKQLKMNEIKIVGNLPQMKALNIYGYYPAKQKF